MKMRLWAATAADLGQGGLVLLLALTMAATGAARPQTPQPSASCSEAPSLQGSRWNLVEDSRMPELPDWSYEFASGGKLVQHKYNDKFPNGTWTQDGTCVSFEINQKYVEFSGVIKGNRIEGTGRGAGGAFTWAVVRRGGGTAAAPAGGLVRRALETGGPESLVRTGTMTYTRVEEKEEEEVKSFSFTTGPDGRLLSAGADRQKMVKKLYDVTLYVDEAGARSALERFKAKDLQKHIGRKDIHEAVLGGTFDKLVTLAFARSWSAKEIRQDFAESLGARTSLDDPAVADFMKCVGRDLKAGDEVVIRVSKGQTLAVSVGGSSCAEISSPSFGRALLGIWIGQNALSGQRDGLLSEAAPLLKQ